MISPNNAFGTWLMPQSEADPIYFDCVTSETVTRDAEITEFPVETGANISDHYRVKLNEVKLEVFVSQEPINHLLHAEGAGFWGAQKLITPEYPTAGGLLGAALGVAKVVVNPLGALASAIGGLLDDTVRPQSANPVLQWAAPFDSLDRLLSTLDAIRSAAGLIDIYTKSAVYSGFVLGQVVTSRTKETGTGTKVSLEFKRIVMVSSQQVAAPKPAMKKDAPPVPKGAQAPKPPGGMQSFASAIKGALLGGP